MTSAGWRTLVLLACPVMWAAVSAGAVPCPADKGSAFAWWVGTWNYSVAGYDAGVTTVAPTGDGCALREEFIDRGGQKQRTSIDYDSTTGDWRRVVVDPFRTYRSTGRFSADGSIAFYETPSTARHIDPWTTIGSTSSVRSRTTMERRGASSLTRPTRVVREVRRTGSER